MLKITDSIGMKVKFDLVRIGKIRKDFSSEKILKQNVISLKKNIRLLLEYKDFGNKNNTISIVMVIPGKGYKIKIALQDILDSNIKKELRQNFREHIYTREYSVLLDNIDNRIF